MIKNPRFVASFVALIYLLLPVRLPAAAIQGVVVSSVSSQYSSLATSTPDRRPASDVVGTTGLFGDIHTPIAPGSMWLTSSNLSNAGGTNAFITFDLGTIHEVDALKVWNYNENSVAGTAAKTNEGVQLANISYSTDNVTFVTNLTSYTFNRAPGTYSAFPQTIPMGGVTARYVRIDVITNWAVANAPVGLAKVRFIDNTVAPTILTATENYGSNQVTVQFSESVDPATATNKANYIIQSGANTATILSAALGEFSDRVVLQTATLTNQTLSLVASGIYDEALTATIANNSTVPIMPELIVWLRADIGVATDGSGNVTQWNDQSVYAHNALTNFAVNQYTAPPTLASGVANGLPAVQFNGSQLLNIPNDANLAINGDVTICLVLDKTVTGICDPISKTGGQGTAYTGTPLHGYTNNLPAPFDMQLKATTGQPVWVWGNGNGGAPATLTGSGGISANSYYIVSITVRGTNVSTYLNGSFDGSANLPEAPADSGTPILLGVRSDSGNVADAGAQFTGYIAEAMVLRGTVTPTDLVNIQNYLGTKYNIPIASLAITEQPQNMTAQVGKTATFWVNAIGVPPLSYQWKSNNVNITGATSSIYTTPALTPSFNNVNYTVTVTSPVGSTNSTAATLTVASDTTAPTVFSATGTSGATNVAVVFSEAVDPITSLNIANYSLTGATVLSASFNGTKSNQVILATTTLSTPASLTVQNVQDQFGNALASPATVSVLPSNLSIWLRGDSGVALDNTGLVDQWLDQSTNNNNAVQYSGGANARPTTGDTINSQPALHFTSGSSNYLQAASSPSLAIVSNITIFAVANFSDYSSPRAIMGKTSGPQPAPFDYYVNSSTAFRFYRGNGTVNALVLATSVPSAGSPHVVSVSMNGTNVSHFLDGSANGTGVLATNIADAGTPLKIGSRDDLSQFMNGDLAEILVFNTALSASDRAIVDNYLGVKYFPFTITQEPANVTTLEGLTANFSVVANQGSAHFTYQWRENSTNILNATNASYITPTLGTNDNGEMYDVIITVPGVSTNTSTPATLNVQADATPPTVVSVGAPIWSKNQIVVIFSEAVDTASADNIANYSLDNGASVLSAVVGPAANRVTLTTSTLNAATSYTLAVQNVKDLFNNAMSPASVPSGVYPPTTALWIRADAGVTSDSSGFVSEWDDQSGNANTLTQPSGSPYEPLLVTNVINGHPVVRFDGTNSYMFAPSSPSLAITGDMAIYAVIDFASYTNAGGSSIVSKTSLSQPASYDYYVTTNGGALRFYRGNGTVSATALASKIPTVGSPHMLGAIMQGNAVTQRLDGAANGNGTINTTLGDNGDYLFIGERVDEFNRLQGDLAELIIFNAALSTNDVVSLENYLGVKYAIQTGPRPTLSLASGTGGSLSLTWPTPALSYTLESTAALTSPVWAPVTNQVTTSSGTNSVTLLPTDTMQFYRLQQQ